MQVVTRGRHQDARKRGNKMNSTAAATAAATIDQEAFVKLVYEFEILANAYLYGRLPEAKKARYYEIVEILDNL
jgi:hypothetical protein